MFDQLYAFIFSLAGSVMYGILGVGAGANQTLERIRRFYRNFLVHLIALTLSVGIHLHYILALTDFYAFIF